MHLMHTVYTHIRNMYMHGKRHRMVHTNLLIMLPVGMRADCQG